MADREYLDSVIAQSKRRLARVLFLEDRVDRLEMALRWALDTVKANPIDGPGFQENMRQANAALVDEDPR